MPGESLIEGHADGENFGPLADRRVGEAFGRQVTGGARTACVGEYLAARSEVDQLEEDGIICGADENVLRFDIAVDKVMAQQPDAGTDKEVAELQRFIDLEPPLPQQGFQARSIHELHDVIEGGALRVFPCLYERGFLGETDGIPSFLEEAPMMKVSLDILPYGQFIGEGIDIDYFKKQVNDNFQLFVSDKISAEDGLKNIEESVNKSIERK